MNVESTLEDFGMNDVEGEGAVGLAQGHTMREFETSKEVTLVLPHSRKERPLELARVAMPRSRSFICAPKKPKCANQRKSRKLDNETLCSAIMGSDSYMGAKGLGS